ncbi:hypothetical protein BJ741DRAFT_592230 [Chytriomyces cf. hyalinus JEL632]|nr:hypothetical protein BJ741DRAFT_592230 [Chytriomyces cf. hyalinus JEL632]
MIGHVSIHSNHPTPHATTTTDALAFNAIQRRDIQSLHKVLQSQTESFEEAPAKKAKIHRTTLPPTISTATVYAGLISESPEVVSLLLEYGANPSLLDNGALIHAALTNNTHVASLLVRDTRVNVCQDNGRAILLATLHRNTHLLQLLLHAIPPTSSYNPTIPLAIAAKNNDTHSATLLLSHPTMHNASPLHLNMTLVFAAGAGNVDVVRGLLQSACVDPSFASGAAYVMAHKNRHADVELVLLNTGRVVKQMESLVDGNGMPVDLAIADPKWWVPVQVDAYKFYDAVVHARI